MDEEVAGEIFVICKAGKPMVRLIPLSAAQAPAPAKRRLGLLLGECSVPDDFDRIAAAAIASLFEGT